MIPQTLSLRDCSDIIWNQKQLRISKRFICSDYKHHHSVHWGINPPSKKKHHLLSFCQAPLFRQFTSIYCFFVNPPFHKIAFFSEPPKYSNFSSLTSYHQISQFKFLVMQEKKHIFVYKPFLSLNISDLVYFLCKNCKPPPPYLFPSNPSLKIEILSTPPFFWEFDQKLHPPPLPPPPPTYTCTYTTTINTVKFLDCVFFPIQQCTCHDNVVKARV